MTDVYVPPSNSTLPTLSSPIEVIVDSDLVALTITYSPDRPSEVVYRRGQFLYPFQHSTREGVAFTVVRDGGWPHDFEVFPDEVAGGTGVSIDGPFVLATADSDLPSARVINAGANISIVDGGPGGTITISATYSGGTGPSPGGAPINVSRSVALAGTSPNYARADHKHDIDTAAPISVGATNIEGTSTAMCRADHQHAGAPVDANYLTLGLNGILSNERTFVVGPGLDFIDGGPGGAYTLLNTLPAPDFNAQYLLWGGTKPADLPNARVVAMGSGIESNILTPGYWTLDINPTYAQPMVVMYDTPGLSNPPAHRRILAAGPGITITDGGDGGNVTISSSVAAGAPTDAPYVTIGHVTGLSAERALVAGANVTITDGGPNGNVTISANVGTGAPVDASYVCIGFDGTLTNERALRAGPGITITDGGANGNVTISSSVNTGAPTDAAYVMIGTDARFSNERSLTVGQGLVATDGGANSTVQLAQATRFTNSRALSLAGVPGVANYCQWSANGPYITQTTSDGGNYDWWIEISNEIYTITQVTPLTSVIVTVKGGVGHAALPQYMPYISLVSMDISGNQTTLFAQSDGSASIGGYEAYHNISWSSTAAPGPIIFDTTKRYFLRITGEAGANIKTNLIAVFASMSFGYI